MKINIGDYVRTKKGIAKIIASYDKAGIDDYDYITDTYLEINYDTEYIYKEDIIGEPSPNIIDLIDEGDYIRIITSAYFDPIYYSYGKLVIRDDIDISNYSNKFIAEVITKEEIERRSYKVGE